MPKIPYGISNFESLITEGYLYVDKTRFVRQIEEMAKFVFFVRPRRFGKSLFVSLLESYYDVAKADCFGQLFGALEIGQQPTDLRSRYLVLRLDFAAIETGQGIDALRRSFQQKVALGFQLFCQRYASLLGNCTIDLNGAPEVLVGQVVNAARQNGQRIYVLIDEYDNFANDLLARGASDTYQEMVQATGFVRTFYKALKEGTTSAIDRIFVTGVAPVMLDDLTSGFNIAENFSLNRALHDTFGFTEPELRDVIRKLALPLDEDYVISEMSTLYNGYRFHKAAPGALYNSDMALYYLLALHREQEPPEHLIDHNVRTDYGRVRSLALSNPANAERIDEILAEERLHEVLIPQFSFDQMYDAKYFVSLLFYLGLLTIGGVTEGLLTLKIPNYAIKTLYWDYFRRLLAERHHVAMETADVTQATRDLAWRGEIGTLAHYVAEHVLQKLSRRDFRHFDEKHIKVILFSLLGMTDFYLCHSEREVERGFIDLFLTRGARFPELPFEWLIELKYLKEGERAQLEAVKDEARAQLQKYASSDEVRRRFRGQTIRQAALIFIGKGEVEIVA